MEALLIVVAVAIAGFVLARGFGADREAEATRTAAPSSTVLAESPLVVGGLPTLATTVSRRVPLHIFTGPPARVHAQALPSPGGDEYTLALGRQAGGRWAPVLHGPTVTTEGGVLTVTLVVPWGELAERFSAVNLVVR